MDALNLRSVKYNHFVLYYVTALLYFFYFHQVSSQNSLWSRDLGYCKFPGTLIQVLPIPHVLFIMNALAYVFYLLLVMGNSAANVNEIHFCDISKMQFISSLMYMPT